MSDNFEEQKPPKGAPYKAILVAALVVVLAGAAFLFMNRLPAMNPVAPDGPVADMMDEANPFPETQAFNLPPQDEMVDETPDPVSADDTDNTDAQAGGSVTIDLDDVFSPRSLGDKNAPIKMDEYFSLTCSHCAHFHNVVLPELRKYIDSGELYIEFHEFPLDGAALRASMVARCLPADKYYGFTSLLFKTQDNWTRNPDYMEMLRQNAKLAGMSDERFDACISDAALQKEMGEKIQEAMNKWKIESTPTFVINGGKEVIKGAQAAYEFERVFRTVTDGKVAALPEEQKSE